MLLKLQRTKEQGAVLTISQSPHKLPRQCRLKQEPFRCGSQLGGGSCLSSSLSSRHMSAALARPPGPQAPRPRRVRKRRS